MFNQSDYRAAKAQQERLLAQAQGHDGRTQRPNPFFILLRRLAARGEKKKEVRPSRKPAQGKA